MACPPGPLPALSCAGRTRPGRFEGGAATGKKDGDNLGGRNRVSTYHSCAPRASSCQAAQRPDAWCLLLSPSKCFFHRLFPTEHRCALGPDACLGPSSSQRPGGHYRTQALPTAPLLQARTMRDGEITAGGEGGRGRLAPAHHVPAGSSSCGGPSPLLHSASHTRGRTKRWGAPTVQTRAGRKGFRELSSGAHGLSEVEEFRGRRSTFPVEIR